MILPRTGLILVLTCVGSAAVAAEGFILEARPAGLAPSAMPVLFVPFAGQAPALDGKLDEPAWRQAAVAGEWREYQVGRETGLPAKVRVYTDGAAVYLGFSVELTDMAQANLRAPTGQGDEYGGSLLEIFFDPTAAGKRKIQFCVNPLGLRYDGLDNDKEWDGSWRSAGHVGPKGWSLEVAVPAEDLGVESITEGARFEGNFAFVDGRGGMHSWTGRWGSPGTDYGVIYFGTRERFLAGVKPGLALLLDRDVYDPRDVTAVALARVTGVDPSAVRALGLRCRVLAGDREVLTQTLAALPGRETDLTLDMRRLDDGEYRLAAELLHGTGAIATAGVTFRKARRKLLPEGQPSGRVAVTVWPAPGAAGARWPISTGVPFAQGVLWSEDNVRLLGPGGREVSCQAGVRARWNREGSIQWLGLDFVPTLAVGPQTYALEYGPKVKRAVAANIQCEETPDRITVTTGKLRFSVRRKGFNLIDSLYLDANGNGAFEPGEQAIAAAPNAGPYLVDHEGTRYDAALDRTARVVVEEKGPLKVTILADGWYVKRASDGQRTSCELPTDRLCKFRVRLTACAGAPTVRCAVTTVVTYDSTRVRLRDLALVIPIKDAQEVRIGSDGAPPLTWPADRLAQAPYLLQHRWDASLDDAGKAHPRATGWVEARTPGVLAVVAMRNFWRLFPKEISFRDGALVWHLWPEHGREHFPIEDQLAMQNIYKLWYAHQGRELDFTFPAAYHDALTAERERTDPPAFGAYFNAMSSANAQGLAIHNDFVLGFYPAAESNRGQQAGFLADEDPHAAPDPAYSCATGVFGPMLHADSDRFGRIETMLARGFDSLAHRTAINHEYGQFIFGGAHTYWWYRRNPVRAGIHRVWLNGHYSIAPWPFVQYVRTGDPMYLRWARNFGANLRDIAMVHYHSDERRFRYHQAGAMYHCKGFAPWAGDAGVSGHMVSTDWLAYDYYLTGNRRSRDAMLEWVEALKKVWPGARGTREGIQTLGEMVQAYRFTWDPALIALMRSYEQAILALPLDKQLWWDYNPLLLMRYHGLTGSEKMLQAYRDVVDSPIGRGGTRHIAAYLALLEDKPELLESWPTRLHRDSISYVDQPGIYADGLFHYMWINYIYLARKMPIVLKALAAFNLEPERAAVTPQGCLPHWDGAARVAVREASDGAIPVRLASAGGDLGKLHVRVFRSDGTGVLDKQFEPEKGCTERSVTIPADGRAEEYLIVIRATEPYRALLLPLTGLAREVAVLRPGTSIILPQGREEGLRYYVLQDAQTPNEIVLSSSSKFGMGMELLDAKQAVVARASDSRYVGDHEQKVVIPPDRQGPLSMYFSDSARLRFRSGRMIIALRPEALFAPRLTAAPP